MRALSCLLIVLATLAIALGAAQAPATTSAPDPSDQRCVLITGANRGIGLEFAKQYQAAGWTVIGTARKPDAATELRATGAEVVQLDVVDAESVARLAAALQDRSVDLLINNAGVSGRLNSVDGMDIERVEHILDVNLVGPMRLTAALLPNLRAGTGKTIVSISSGLGSIERNTGARHYGYRESKAGLNMFMRSLAAELRKDGFKCVAMSPGWVQTDMGGPGATLTPEQSISGMRKVIAELTPERSGMFLNHDGAEIPW